MQSLFLHLLPLFDADAVQNLGISLHIRLSYTPNEMYGKKKKVDSRLPSPSIGGNASVICPPISRRNRRLLEWCFRLVVSHP